MKVMGIVGAGVMGLGIAQIAALAGLRVKMFDVGEGVAEKGCDRLAETLMALVSRNKIEATTAEAAIARIETQSELAGLADCDVLVEAIVERLDAKQQLFVQLESIVRPDAILASNTSSHSITIIASACERPQRVVGFHFFNPVPLMKIVEVVAGERTDPEVTSIMLALGTRLGHRAVLASDTPGFIVNHAGRGYVTEGMKILQEGVAPVEAVDCILRGIGFRMGPYQLLDLTGLDVSHPVMESIYDQFYGDPRYRPSYVLRRRMAAGLLGKKVGRGFYDYGEPAAAENPTVEATPVAGERASGPVWIWAAFDDWRQRLVTLAMDAGATVEDGDHPSPDALCLVAPAGEDATATAQMLRVNPERVLAVDMLGNPAVHAIMGTMVTEDDCLQAARTLLAASAPVVEINDSAGFVAQRTLAMIVNIAAEMAQQRIAHPDDIDAAVKLGLGYPFGPFEWGDRLGPTQMLAISEALFRETGDARYRPSPWLVRRARLGISLLQPDRLG
jgi:3-hydroxybutyryl-CoA dehydrogenase